MSGVLLALLSVARPAAADPMADLVAGRAAASPELAGLAVVVAGPDGVIRQQAWGRAVIGAGERPYTAATPTRVASISKLVVAIAVMRLAEARTLDLDRDVSAYLGWRLRNPAFPGAPVTLRQLLSHTSGLDDASGYSFPLGTALQDALTLDHWSAAPGARFSYANINYGVIATVMEAATGERFDRLMRRLVLEPLQLDACFNWSGCSAQAMAAAAALYRTGRDETDWHPDGDWVAQIDALGTLPPACLVRTSAACDLDAYAPGTNGTLFSPQGGLRISALGLAKIGRLLLGQGRVDGVRLLRPASVAALLTPVWTGGASGETYAGLMRCYTPGLQCLTGGPGHGDQPVPGKSLRWFGHLGEAYGLHGGLWIDPAARRAYVYLITGSKDDLARYPRISGFMGAEAAAILDFTDVKKN